MMNEDDNGQQEPPSEFMSLSEKIKSYEYPKATDSRLVIKMNETGIGYVRDYEETELANII